MFLEKRYGIYEIISPSGKIYIGQSSNMAERKKCYRYNSVKDQPLIYNSLKKYGWKSHCYSILFEEMFTKEEVDVIEIALIKMYKDSKISLNIADGGSSGNTGQNKRICQFDLDANYIKTFESYTNTGFCVTSLSLALKSKTKYSNGYLWAKEEDYLSGINLPTLYTFPFICIDNPAHKFDLKGNYISTYTSLTEACKSVPCDTKDIVNNLKGVTKRVKNFIFSRDLEIKKYVNPRFKKIYLYKISGEFIKEFDSSLEVKEEMNISLSTVNILINRVYKSAKETKYSFFLSYNKYLNYLIK